MVPDIEVPEQIVLHGQGDAEMGAGTTAQLGFVPAHESDPAAVSSVDPQDREAVVVPVNDQSASSDTSHHQTHHQRWHCWRVLLVSISHLLGLGRRMDGGFCTGGAR